MLDIKSKALNFSRVHSSSISIILAELRIADFVCVKARWARQILLQRTDFAQCMQPGTYNQMYTFHKNNPTICIYKYTYEHRSLNWLESRDQEF